MENSFLAGFTPPAVFYRQVCIDFRKNSSSIGGVERFLIAIVVKDNQKREKARRRRNAPRPERARAGFRFARPRRKS
jgi:hypothetical protein